MIQFVDVDGRRVSIRLGAVSKRTAAAVKLRVEQLLNAKILNVPLDRDTASWVAGIGAPLAERLARAGLIARPSQETLGQFTARYIRQRTDIKPRTRINLEQCRRRLTDFLGDDRQLGSITPADADRWIVWLKERGYAPGTIGRTVKRARQFFRAAVRDRILAASPFDEVKTPSAVPAEARKFFVSREMIDKVLQACPDAEWRLMVALCRYGGLRCPSELLSLTWEDINWERDRFCVRSCKTEHHEGGGQRWVPIFPELRPYLEEVFQRAPEGALYVINRYRDTNQNLRAVFARIIRRAGLTPWPKVFHNLRASRETELAAEYPLHVACAWIGNSAAIAHKHYLQVTDADFQRAAKSDAPIRPALHNPMQTMADREGQGSI